MKSKLGIALLAILIFVLGGVAGGFSYYIYCERQKATVRSVEDVVEWMATELKLDQQQQAQVRAIITDIRTRYRGLWQEFRPRYVSLRKESDDRINALLRENQKPLFEAFLKKLRSATPATPQPATSKKGN